MNARGQYGACLLLVAGLLLNQGCKLQSQYTQTPEPTDIMSLWDYNDPAGTERRFLELLPKARASGDPAYLGKLLTQIARTYSLRAMFVEAHATLDQVQPMLARGGAELNVRYRLELGRAYNSAGDKARARPLFIEAWDRAIEADLAELAVDAAHMVGIVEEPDAALAWNLKALKIVEASDDQEVRGWLGPLYNNIGWTYFERGEAQTALIYFEKGLAFRIQRQQVPETRIAKWAVARAYRELGRVDEALATQQALQREIDAAGDPPDGYV